MTWAFTTLWWLLVAVQITWQAGVPTLAAAFAAPLLLVGISLLRGSTARRRAIASLVSLPYFVVGTTEWMVERSLGGAAVVVVCVLLYLAIVAINARNRQAPISDAIEEPPEVE
ncbi:MAG: DUF2069 domain-containing protein [Pseudomonadota bacterium]